MIPSIRFFISCASKEFQSYRTELRSSLTSNWREIKVQEDFVEGPGTLLEKLDNYIDRSSAVLHLVGHWAGSKPTPAEVRTILGRYPDLALVLPELSRDLVANACPFTYTQWEAFLAIYHRVPCFIYIADDESEREVGYSEDPDERAAQSSHLGRLSALGQDRRMLAFSDAREVANRFLNSYLDITMGIPLTTVEPEPLPPTWPNGPASVQYPLANREPEFELFLQLVTGVSQERILFIYGASDRGKTTLMNQWRMQAEALDGLQCASAEFKTGLPLHDVLWSLVQDLRGIRFPRFMREFERDAIESLRLAFLQDLSETRHPVALLLDTYDQATEEARQWVEQHLLHHIRRFKTVRLVLAGQKVPTFPSLFAWAKVARWHELQPIREVEPWRHYLHDILGLIDYGESHIQMLVAATGGSPRALGALLNNLKRQAC